MGPLVEADQKGRFDRFCFGAIELPGRSQPQSLAWIGPYGCSVLGLGDTESVHDVVLNDPEVKKQFGMDILALKEKNTASIFKFKPSPTIPLSPYLNDIQKIIRQVPGEMIVNKKDINTAHKEAQETADKKIAELMSK